MSTKLLPTIAVHTDYTLHHMDDSSYCASNMSFQIGAVVINEQDEILVFEDLESGISSLPRIEVDMLDVSLKSPFEFIHDKAGLRVERLPLLKPKRQYRNKDVARWRDLESELVFEDTLTTIPFAVALDISWFRVNSDPRFPDGRQAIVNWYSGIVRGDTLPYQSSSFRASFMPLDDAICEVIDHSQVAETALILFDALWTATKRLQPSNS